jgi:antitoxin (DNA-binding transcriptional repressor) of toxin-antitoxin stability system
MKTVKIAELKNRLSYYLRRVRQGESILIADRDHVIARIERVAPMSEGGSETEWLDRLERSGVIRRAAGPPSKQWLARRPTAGADVVGALLQEREESR